MAELCALLHVLIIGGSLLPCAICTILHPAPWWGSRSLRPRRRSPRHPQPRCPPRKKCFAPYLHIPTHTELANSLRMRMRAPSYCHLWTGARGTTDGAQLHGAMHAPQRLPTPQSRNWIPLSGYMRMTTIDNAQDNCTTQQDGSHNCDDLWRRALLQHSRRPHRQELPGLDVTQP